MASRSLGTLTLDLIARVGGFVEGMTKAERETAKATKKMQKDMDDLKKSAVAFGKGAALALAAAASAATAAGIAIYKSGAQSVGSLAAMSDQIGVATEDLVGLRFAAQQMSEMAEGTFDVSLRRMVRRLSEAADGAGPAVNAIKSLGLEASALAKLSPEQQFHAIANAMSGIADQGTKMRATMAIFDTEGMPLINTLSQGSDAIRGMQDQAEQLGLTVSRLDAAKVEAANNAIAAAMQTSRAFSQQLAIQFAPAVQAMVNLFSEMSSEMGGMDKVAVRVFNGVIEAAAFLADVVDGLVRVVKVAANVWILSWNTMANKVLGTIDGLLAGMGSLSSFLGLDFVAEGVEALREFGRMSGEIEEMAKQEIANILEEPLAGNKLKKFVAEAQAASEQAAQTLASVSPPAANDPVFTVDDQLEKRLQSLRESFFTEEQMLGAKFVKEQQLLAEHYEGKAALKDEWDALSLQSEQEYEDSLTAIKERGAAARLAAVGSALSTISTLMNGESRKLFEIGKAAAIAQATISMYEGVMKAWALGPILGPILAPLVAAAGAMNIRGIASTKFGGGSAAVSNTQSINNSAAGVGGGDTRNVYMHGIDPNQNYSGSQLLDVLNGELMNGGRLMGVNP